MTGPDTTASGGAPHLRTRREWIVLAVGVVVVAALCLLAGRWQWNRHLDRDERIAVVVANYEAEPVPLDALVPAPGVRLDPDDEWRRVTVRGEYRVQDTVLLRNRPVASTAGFHVLVPFEVAGGAGLVLIVDRGFVPMGADGSGPDAVPDPPAGVVTLTARLRPDEPASTRGAPPGQTQSITTEAVLEGGPDGSNWARGRTAGLYLALESENPSPAQPLHGLPEPSTDPGSHLSYTFQWVVFAAGAIGGFVLLLRRERREASRRASELVTGSSNTGAEPNTPGLGGPLPPGTPEDVAQWIRGATPADDASRSTTRARPGRELTDEEIEDAQVDAHGQR